MENPLSRFLAPQQSQVQGNQVGFPMMPAQEARGMSAGVDERMLNGLQSMVNMFNGSNQKGAVMQTLAGANPQMGELMQICAGRDPKQVFIEECQRRGIDANYALSVMSRIGIR